MNKLIQSSSSVIIIPLSTIFSDMLGRRGIQALLSIGSRHRTARPPRLLGAIRHHGGPDVPEDAPTITIKFLQPDETSKEVQARIGESFLQTAHRNDIDLEGACEGVCACSTCHLIFPDEIYDTLSEASEEEEDMLDMAFGLTDTSRLGCQVEITGEMEGITVTMPKATRNMYVDGHVPKPH